MMVIILTTIITAIVIILMTVITMIIFITSAEKFCSRTVLKVRQNSDFIPVKVRGWGRRAMQTRAVQCRVVLDRGRKRK